MSYWTQACLWLEAVPAPAAGPVQPEGVGVDAEPLGGLQRDPLHGHGRRKAGKSSPRRSSATRVTGTPAVAGAFSSFSSACATSAIRSASW